MAKKKNNTKRFQIHFRKFHSKEFTGHPQYVYDEHGNEYKVVGITSSPKTNGVDNILLSCNPKPNNKDEAYIRPTPNTINKGVRNEKLKGWKFADIDKPKVRQVISNEKKKPRK